MNKNLFSREEGILQHYRNPQNEKEFTSQDVRSLTDAYAELLEQTQFITTVSDRLEKKIQLTNQDLQTKNNALQNMLVELTQARAGKRAMAIIYSVAIILFVLEEFFVEPLIDLFHHSLWFSVLVKLSIVLLLKPAEGILERYLIRSNLKQEISQFAISQ